MKFSCLIDRNKVVVQSTLTKLITGLLFFMSRVTHWLHRCRCVLSKISQIGLIIVWPISVCLAEYADSQVGIFCLGQHDNQGYN